MSLASILCQRNDITQPGSLCEGLLLQHEEDGPASHKHTSPAEVALTHLTA